MAQISRKFDRKSTVFHWKSISRNPQFSARSLYLARASEGARAAEGAAAGESDALFLIIILRLFCLRNLIQCQCTT